MYLNVSHKVQFTWINFPEFDPQVLKPLETELGYQFQFPQKEI